MTEGGTVQSYTLPPPVSGINFRDSIDAMDPSYCLEALNVFSHGQTVALRKGTTLHAYNIGSTNATAVFEYALQDGTIKLLAVSNNFRTYDITAGGASPTDLSAGGTLLVGALPSTVIFRNRLFIKDSGSTNDVWYWDGAAASLAAAAFTGPGGDDKALTAISSFKSRLYFAGADASVWYGGIDAVTGALTQFDVQSLLSLGGVLYYAGPANKLGDTNQQYFAMISSRGEVLIYQGDYPGSVTWSLVGQYSMPPPASRRSFFFWGANLVIITVQGVVLLSDVINSTGDLTYLSERINPEFVNYVNDASFNTWVNGLFYPSGNFILINVYDQDEGKSRQFIMSTINRSWWLWDFPNLDNITYQFSTWGSQLVFTARGLTSGSNDGHVYIADTGEFDTDPNNSAAVATREVLIRQAFSYLDDRKNVKAITQIRPIIKMNNGITIRAGVNADYDNTAIGSSLEYSDTSDVSSKVYRPILQAQADGKAISFRIDKLHDNGHAELYATEIFYETGGPFA